MAKIETLIGIYEEGTITDPKVDLVDIPVPAGTITGLRVALENGVVATGGDIDFNVAKNGVLLFAVGSGPIILETAGSGELTGLTESVNQDDQIRLDLEAMVQASLASDISFYVTIEVTSVLGEEIADATGKTTPVDADELALSDSAASNVLKKLTWANLKATLKTYFDTLYTAVTGGTVTVATGDLVVIEDVSDSNSIQNVTAQSIADLGSGGTASSTTEVLTGTDSSKFNTPDSLAALWEQGSDVASAGTISLGEGGYFNITGTTTITDIDFATDKAGRKAWLKFAGILTLTHNATTLILPTGANIITAAGDLACFVSEGSDNVRCVAYQRTDGTALVGGVSDGDKGDVTVSSSGSVWTVDNEAITYAKMQHISAASRLLGRGSAGGAGDVEEITLGTNLSMSGTTLNSSGGVVAGGTFNIDDGDAVADGTFTFDDGDAA